MENLQKFGNIIGDLQFFGDIIGDLQFFGDIIGDLQFFGDFQLLRYYCNTLKISYFVVERILHGMS